MDLEQRTQLAERVIEARRSRGWSQVKLAEQAGVSENTVISIENHKRDTQDGKLRAVLDALGMTTPADGFLSLEGVPSDVRAFLRVASRRLMVMDEAKRSRVLTDLYPRLLQGD